MRAIKLLVLCVAVLVVAFVGWTLLGRQHAQPASAAPAARSTSRAEWAPPVLPVPPKPATIRNGTPDERAEAFATLLQSPLPGGPPSGSGSPQAQQVIESIKKQLATMKPGDPGYAQISEALAMTAQEPTGRLATWLGIYDAVGVPVIGQDGRAIGGTGDDPVGPQFWRVWYASGFDSLDRGVSLSDAGRLLGAGTPKLDRPELGPILLSDIRLAANSSEPRVRLLGRFIRLRILSGVSHVDLLDPAVTAEKVVIDLPTLQLVAWVLIRDVFIDSAKHASVAFHERTSDLSLLSAAYAQEGGEYQAPCSVLPFGEDANEAIDFFIRKVAAPGFKPPGGKSFPGLVEQTLHLLGASHHAIELTKIGLPWAQAISSLITLALRVSALEVKATQAPDPLERTRHWQNDGDPGNVTFILSSHPKPMTRQGGDVPDPEQAEQCLASFSFSLFGLNFKRPGIGPIPGAEMTFTGGQGFTNLVFIPDHNKLRQDTNEKGEVTLPIMGEHQPQEVPASAKPIEKNFSVFVSAQPGKVGIFQMLGIFISGLAVGGGAVGGGVAGGTEVVATAEVNGIEGLGEGADALVDVLETIHYDLGESVFRLTDWGGKRRISFANVTIDCVARLPKCSIRTGQVISGHACGDPLRATWTIDTHDFSQILDCPGAPPMVSDYSFKNDCVPAGGDEDKRRVEIHSSSPAGGGWHCAYSDVAGPKIFIRHVRPSMCEGARLQTIIVDATISDEQGCEESSGDAVPIQ